MVMLGPVACGIGYEIKCRVEPFGKTGLAVRRCQFRRPSMKRRLPVWAIVARASLYVATACTCLAKLDTLYKSSRDYPCLFNLYCISYAGDASSVCIQGK